MCPNVEEIENISVKPGCDCARPELGAIHSIALSQEVEFANEESIANAHDSSFALAISGENSSFLNIEESFLSDNQQRQTSTPKK